MVRLPLLPLPESNEGKLALFSTVMCLVLLVRIGHMQAQLDAKPLVEDFKVDARTEDVRRGQVTVRRHTEIKPDGTKTVDSERVQGAVESHSEAKTETSHKEIPNGLLARPRTRYVGLGVDPLDYARLPRMRAGLTLWERVDAGLAYDARRPILGGALTLEAAYRF